MAVRTRRAIAEPQIEGPAAEDAQNLDEAAQEGQSHRTGQVSEDDLGRSIAKRMGWTDREDWKRDPAKWRDWRDYLDDTPKELEALKERNRRTAQAAADAIEEQRRVARIEAQREVREAAEAQDPERAERAAQELAKVSGPPPETVAWMGRNTWFNDDPVAQQFAVAVINRAAGQQLSIPEQLEAAEREVKRRFPEHFGQAEREESREVPLSESRHKPAPAVQGGTRDTNVRTREKGFADIPAGDQAIFRQKLARYFPGAEGEQKYARSYWANKG